MRLFLSLVLRSAALIIWVFVLFYSFLNLTTSQPISYTVGVFLMGCVVVAPLFSWGHRLKEPRAAKPKAPRPNAPVAQSPAAKPLPTAPQAAQERRFAVPPTVGVSNPMKASVRASMAPQLRVFVCKGEQAITEED